MEKTLYRTVGSVAFAALLALVLLGGNLSTAYAQSTGTILGTVQDSTGAVIPNTTVTVHNVNTGFTRTQPSQADGSYRFAALLVGTYEIRASLAGFQTEPRRAR